MPSLLHALATCLLAFWPTQQVPANDGWVTDRAGVLSREQERALEAQLEAYKQGSTNEVAVLVVAKLEGTTIEKLALDAGRAWKVGSEEKANGVVLAVALEDRKMRIEVGPGLGGLLTDAQCGRIIRDVIAPRFRANDVYGGLQSGLLSIQGTLGGDRAAIPSAKQPSVGAGVAKLIFLVIAVLVMLLARRGRGGGVGTAWMIASILSQAGGHRRGGGGFGGGGGGGFSGFGGGGRFGGGGASGGW